MKEEREEKILKLGKKSFLDYITKNNPEFLEETSHEEFVLNLPKLHSKYKQQKMIDIDMTRKLC